MQDLSGESAQNERDMDRPRSVAGIAALESLHAAGFKKSWLGVTRALKDHVAFSEVVRERGGGRLEEFVRIFSGNGGESLYAALIDHGVAEDVARRARARGNRGRRDRGIPDRSLSETRKASTSRSNRLHR